MFGFYYAFYWVVIPGILLALWAQWRVHSTYRRYLRIGTQGGLTGHDAARRILDSEGLYDVQIEAVPGDLTDHYDPRDRTLRLSQRNYQGRSVASLGVAAHEAGHALQHKEAYVPLQLRMAVIPITTFGSQLLVPMAVFGLIFLPSMSKLFLNLAIVGYAVMLGFQVITLPVEFDASRRAKASLVSLGVISPQEQGGVASVLGAAAWTYVAAMVVALLNLVRLLMMRNRE